MGTRQPCPGETVTYTCTLNQGFQLDWIVEPYITGSTRIRFMLDATPIGRSMDCNDVSPPQCDNINFVATFTNTANPMTVMNTTVADMTSTLTFTATARLNGTVVQCRGATAARFPIANRTLNLIAVGKSFDSCFYFLNLDTPKNGGFHKAVMCCLSSYIDLTFINLNWGGGGYTTLWQIQWPLHSHTFYEMCSMSSK